MALSKFQENGHTYYRLYFKCPVCFEQGKAIPTTYLKHGDANCFGDMYVGDNAFYKCVKCGYSAHARNWTYTCPSCSGASDGEALLKSDSGGQDCKYVVSMAGQIVSETGQEWLLAFMDNLGEDESR